MNRVITTFVMLSGTWLLWSGHLESMLLISGFASVLLVMFISHRMDASVNHPRVYRLGLRPLIYAPWLLWQIVKSNLSLARIILQPKLRVAPHLIQVHASQKTDLGQVIYCNSITLTPGTVTLDVRDNTILVHALTKEAAVDLKSGEMDRRVASMEGSS